jgi:hypothetical protein
MPQNGQIARMMAERFRHNREWREHTGYRHSRKGPAMHSTVDALPIAAEALGVISRQTEWGDLNVAAEHFPAGLDTGPIFTGLPGNRCQCPHWGYVVTGELTVVYHDHDEIVPAGSVYYIAPDHTTRFAVDTDLVEFSPAGEYQKTMEIVGQNVAAMTG